jgi:outer membrane lipoprotein-sorting protein
MRWTFTTGNKSEVVSNGTEIYSYFPQDKLVHVRPYPKADEAALALLFLAGRGDLVRDFVPALPATQPPGEWQVALTPKAKQADFVSLTLAVDPISLQWRGFVIVDEQGGTRTFRLSNLRENQTIRDEEFTFKIPRGVEVRR